MGAGETLNLWALTLLILPGTLGGQWAVRYPEKPVCAVRGSTVDINCTYDHPEEERVNKTMWFYTNSECVESKYVCHSGNKTVSPECRDRAECLRDKEKICGVKIKNIRHTDVGVYRFRLYTHKNKWCGRTGATLQVAELKVTMNSTNGTIREGESVKLICGPEEAENCYLNQSEIIWYKNNQLLPETGSTLHLHSVSLSVSGNYSCALKDQEPTVSMGFILDVGAQSKIPSVTAALAVVLFLLAAALGIIIYMKRRKRDTQTMEKDTPRETQFAEDKYYSTVAEYNVSETRHQTQDVSSQEEEVSYAAIQFNTKKPAKTRAARNLKSDDDPVVYGSVVKDSIT